MGIFNKLLREISEWLEGDKKPEPIPVRLEKQNDRRPKPYPRQR